MLALHRTFYFGKTFWKFFPIFSQNLTPSSSCFNSPGGSFTSIAAVAAELSPDKRKIGNDIYIVYSISKDFALSGLRVGCAYSENQEVLNPVRKLNDLCQVSSQTQLLVSGILDDKIWLAKFREENLSRTRERCDILQGILRESGVPFLKPEGGLYVWCDLSQFLDGKSEEELFDDLVDRHGLLFTPGKSMMMGREGFFRIVFTAVDEKGFEEGMMRFKRFLESRKPN